jgi:hypothetical protein
VRKNARKSAKLRCAELMPAAGKKRFMSPPQAALRPQALVMAVAFPHHAVQENTVRDACARFQPAECAT